MLARGECSSTSAIHCGVECDGGGVDLEPQKDGSLLVRLKRKDGDFIRMSLGCGGDEDEGSVLRSGVDDHAFKLHMGPPALCRDMDAAIDQRIEKMFEEMMFQGWLRRLASP
jgi:hypothetical protein